MIDMWMKIVLAVLSGAAGALILLLALSIADHIRIKRRAEEEVSELIDEVMYMREIIESLKPGESIASRNAIVIVDADGNVSGWFGGDGRLMICFGDNEKA